MESCSSQTQSICEFCCFWGLPLCPPSSHYVCSVRLPTRVGPPNPRAICSTACTFYSTHLNASETRKSKQQFQEFLENEGEIFHWKSLIITYKGSSPELQWRFFEDFGRGPLILDLWFCSYFRGKQLPFYMVLCSLLVWGWLLDTGSRPSVVDDW